MASNIGPRTMGEFPNFNFEDGTVSGWSGTRSIFEGDSSDGLGANKYCMETTGRWSTSAWNSGQRYFFVTFCNIEKLQLAFANRKVEVLFYRVSPQYCQRSDVNSLVLYY